MKNFYFKSGINSRQFIILVLVTFSVFTTSAQNWSLTGNSGTNSAVNWIGTSDSQRLVFKVNNAESATLTTTKVSGIDVPALGIGTSTPNHSFQIVGGNGFNISYPGGTNFCFFEPDYSTGWNFGLWNGAWSTNLKIDAKSILMGTRGSNARVGIGLAEGVEPNANSRLDVGGNIFTSGKLAIGTTDMAKIGDNALAVNGSGLFTKVKVKVYTGWPDYVFKLDYHLPSLGEVNDYIKQHGHLEGVPSARDVETNDLDVGSTQAILLKKIEELTLYVIQQQKELDVLKAAISHSHVKK